MSNGAKSDNQAQRCQSLPGSFVKTVALAVDLGQETVLDSPDIIKKILSDAGFQKALTKALEAEGKRLMKARSSGEVLDWRESNAKLGKTIGTAAADAAQKKAISLIKASPEYDRLQRGLKELGCAFDQSPVGVFIDQNRTWLIVVGVIGAIGGAAAMYYTQAGDVPAKAFELLPKLKPIQIGNVAIQARQVRFEPSTRTVKAELGAIVKWDAVKADFTLMSSLKNDQFMAAGASAGIVIKPDSRTTISAKTRGGWDRGDEEKGPIVKTASQLTVKTQLSYRSTLNFQLVHNYEYQESKHQHTFGGEVSNTTGDIFGKGTLTTVGVRGESKFGTENEYKGEVFLRITFGK